jgi:hypothetical protein
MGRVAKNKPAAEPEAVTPTVTQSRTRRTPKPNPKYAGESVVLSAKLDDTPIASDGEEKPVDVKKPGKKSLESAGKPTRSTPVPKKTPPIKKTKLDLSEVDDESQENPIEDSKPAGRSTRSAKTEEVKVGEESVAIVDVASIIGKSETPAAVESRATRGRKRGGAEDNQPEETPKKKKDSEEEKEEKKEIRPSAITTRKSYLPASANKKAETEAKPESPQSEAKTLPAGIKVTRLNSGSESPKKEVDAKPEPKKLPFVRKAEVGPKSPIQKSPLAVQTKVVAGSKPVPRILNSMVSQKGKQSPNIKLTSGGDDKDKKVFSIDLTDDSLKERKLVSSPVKPSAAVRQLGGTNLKENIRTPPSAVLRNKLENELGRMKANANIVKRNSAVASPYSVTNQYSNQNQVARRITKFESWYVIDVKPNESKPFRHTHTYSLINMGNNISDIKMPSEKWDYKINFQYRSVPAKAGEEVFTGEVPEKSMEKEKHNYEPVNILFKRTQVINGKNSIDRSLMIKKNLFTITMNGKQCKLIGAPDDIKSLEDLEILLDIIDTSLLTNRCVELVTAEDNMIK